MPRVMPLSAGELNQRITIQVQAATKDDRGQRVQVWNDEVGPVWARARPGAVSEFLGADAVQTQDLVVFSIRYRAGMQSRAARRVLWNGAPYDLTGIPVDVDGGRHTLELTCSGGKPT